MDEDTNPYRSAESAPETPPPRRWSKAAALLLALLATAAALYCLYAAAFFAWVTATPATEEMRAQARFYANLWSTAFLVLAALAAYLFGWLIYVLTRSR